MIIFKTQQETNYNKHKQELMKNGVVKAPFIISEGLNSSLIEIFFEKQAHIPPLIRKGFFENGGYYHVAHLNMGEAKDLIAKILTAQRIRDLVIKITGHKQKIKSIVNVLLFDKLEQRLDWHTDNIDTGPKRYLGFSIILCAPKQGGDFQIRRKNTDIVSTIKPLKGEIILFQVADTNWEHRVLSIMGQLPRLSLSGWFVETQR